MNAERLLRWTDPRTGLVHLVDEDLGWHATYCTWRTIEHPHVLMTDTLLTCVRCIAIAPRGA